MYFWAAAGHPKILLPQLNEKIRSFGNCGRNEKLFAASRAIVGHVANAWNSLPYKLAKPRTQRELCPTYGAAA